MMVLEGKSKPSARATVRSRDRLRFQAVILDLAMYLIRSGPNLAFF